MKKKQKAIASIVQGYKTKARVIEKARSVHEGHEIECYGE